ncbi:MAG: hypothetical protein IJ055_01935 [Oscillospiraceae bacterium]|nr:hypothetical protein [Oscillospiraceae bacterium]
MYVISSTTPVRTRGGIPMKLVELRCDSAQDIPLTPPACWEMGSIAWDIGAGVFYGLNSDREWVSQSGDGTVLAPAEEESADPA